MPAPRQSAHGKALQRFAAKQYRPFRSIFVAWQRISSQEFERLPPDPHGQTYGFFDGHGWNMAFDRVRGRLNGIYDFADSGFGPVHQEFIYSNFISPDLTERIAAAYEKASGRTLDKAPYRVPHPVFIGDRNWQSCPDDSRHTRAMTRHTVIWLETMSGPRFRCELMAKEAAETISDNGTRRNRSRDAGDFVVK